MIWDIVGSVINKVLDRIPDPAAREAAKIEMVKANQAGEFKELDARYSAILAEATSSDPYTSRARPAFMYLFYFVLLMLVIVAPFVGVFFPAQMTTFYANVGAGFADIPEAMWWTFSAGYLGYTTARTIEKRSGVTK